MTIRFDDQVAIVTGAGNGLGRSHALALAARGAKVVVNDLGGARDGVGKSRQAAEAVAEEIKAAGGDAIANGADVTRYDQVQSMVDDAMSNWGRVDILVNNAGVLRDKSFAKMEVADFEFVVKVHLMGTMHCSKAVWEIMRGQTYGRIVMTTSGSGLYGNFGQSNYAAAKMGVVGLMNVLHLEGLKYGIRVNTLAPCAATRMTEDLISKDAAAALTPESVSAGLVYLVSRDAPARCILSAGGGAFACARIHETQGRRPASEDLTPEAVAADWDAITDPAGQKDYQNVGEQTASLLSAGR